MEEFETKAGRCDSVVGIDAGDTQETLVGRCSSLVPAVLVVEAELAYMLGVSELVEEV